MVLKCCFPFVQSKNILNFQSSRLDACEYEINQFCLFFIKTVFWFEPSSDREYYFSLKKDLLYGYVYFNVLYLYLKCINDKTL